MNKIRTLIAKFLNRETRDYIIFGVLTTIVSYVSYFIFARPLEGIIGRDNAVMLATALAWCCAVAFAFVTNKLFVFKSKSWSFDVIKIEIPAFLGARIFSGVFEFGWMWLTAVYLGWDDLLCKFIAQVIITVMNYFFSKLFIFKKNRM